MIELPAARRRALRAAAHHLDPVVSISQKGLQPAVLAEIDRSLNAHELIKVRLYGIEREAREEMLVSICDQLSCAPVQQIGNLLVLWRERSDADAARETSAPARRQAARPANKKQAAAAISPRRRIKRT